MAGKCVNFTTILFSGAGFSIAEDILITLLPLPVLSSLNMTLKKKIAVGFMFCMGSL